MNKIVLMLVDGMRPDGFLACGNPYIEELQRTTVLRWAAPYLSPSFDTNTGICILLSAFLGQEQLLSLDHILIRILLLAVEKSDKLAAFYRKLYHARLCIADGYDGYGGCENVTS